MIGLIGVKNALSEIQQSNLPPLINYSHYDNEKEERSLGNIHVLQKKSGNNDTVNRSRSDNEKQKMRTKQEAQPLIMNNNNEQNQIQIKKNGKTNQIAEMENLNPSKNYC